MSRYAVPAARRPRLVTVQEAFLDETKVELIALIDEGRDLAVWLVSLARLAQVQLSRGQSPAQLLDELERVGNQHLTRMTSAGVIARLGEPCMDGQLTAGHGRAA